jgi:two-component system, OmpR family, sensor histidine kinase CpxA
MKLFWRIFLSFWLSSLLMIAAVLVTRELFPGRFPGDRDAVFQPESAAATLTQAVDTYEQHGEAAFLSQIRGISAMRQSAVYLLDQNGNVLVKDGDAPPFFAPLAGLALQSDQSELIRYGLRMILAYPIQSATGRRYALVLTIFNPRQRLVRFRFWFSLATAMVPAALVCMLLTLYITRPITRLRWAAQRLAGGDLNARSAPRRIERGDELGDLGRDFDTMAAQIQSLMTAQRRFVADVSHELGAPLTRLHLALALLRRQFIGKNTTELERIERETDKLSNLVQQLLLLAGIEAGARPTETMTTVSMRSLCDSIIEDASFEADHKKCHITGSRRNVDLLVYPQLLRRAIDNVLRNAIRYAPEGTDVLFNCTVEHGFRHVIIEVLDSGPGVPEALLTDIFLPFFRTAPGREASSGGTGLGLAIATEAVRLHGGTITARNRNEGGLQVTITLPLQLPVPEQEPESATAEI